MKIKSTGYPIKFIQTHPVSILDQTCHLKSYVYKFYSPKTGLQYIVRAEHHELDFFAIKFYAKKDRKSDRKYFNVINKGDVPGILVTVAKVVPFLLEDFPKASFGFIGSRSLDRKSNKLEPLVDNQRFRLYKHHIPQLIGNKTFSHFAYTNGSAYSLINRSVPDVDAHEKMIRNQLIRDYPDLVAING